MYFNSTPERWKHDDLFGFADRYFVRFSDIKEDDEWCGYGIAYCGGKGYIAGLDNNTYAPNKVMDRATFVTVLRQIAGADTSDITESRFADVADDTWYCGAAEWAFEHGYTAGIGEDENGDPLFGPDMPVTREQFATFLRTFARLNGYDVSASADISRYWDRNKIADWALDSVSWAVASGMMFGTSDVSLSPGMHVARSQIAVIVMKFDMNVLGRR